MTACRRTVASHVPSEYFFNEIITLRSLFRTGDATSVKNADERDAR